MQIFLIEFISKDDLLLPVPISVTFERADSTDIANNRKSYWDSSQLFTPCWFSHFCQGFWIGFFGPVTPTVIDSPIFLYIKPNSVASFPERKKRSVVSDTGWDVLSGYILKVVNVLSRLLFHSVFVDGEHVLSGELPGCSCFRVTKPCFCIKILANLATSVGVIGEIPINHEWMRVLWCSLGPPCQTASGRSQWGP